MSQSSTQSSSMSSPAAPVELTSSNFESIVASNNNTGGIVLFYDEKSKSHEKSRRLFEAVNRLANECQSSGRTVVVAKVNCDNFDYHKPELLSLAPEEESEDDFPDKLTEHIFRIVYVEKEVLPTVHVYHGGDALTDDFLCASQVDLAKDDERLYATMLEYVDDHLDESPIQCLKIKTREGKAESETKEEPCTDRTFDFLIKHHGKGRYFGELDGNRIQRELDLLTSTRDGSSSSLRAIDDDAYRSRLADALRALLKQQKRADIFRQMSQNVQDLGNGILGGRIVVKDSDIFPSEL